MWRRRKEEEEEEKEGQEQWQGGDGDDDDDAGDSIERAFEESLEDCDTSENFSGLLIRLYWEPDKKNGQQARCQVARYFSREGSTRRKVIISMTLNSF